MVDSDIDEPISSEVRLGTELAALIDAEPDKLTHALPQMHEALMSTQPHLTILAIVMAGRAGTAGLPVLREALQSDQVTIRQFAAQGLGQLGPDPAVVEALVKAAKDPDPITGEIASLALGRAGKAALDPLRLLVRESDPAISIRALKALGQAGKGTGLPLLELDAARSYPDPRQAIAAAEAAVQSSGNPGKGLGDLIMQMESSDPGIRKEAADASGRLMDTARAAAPQLQRLLAGDDEPEVRGAAATALALIGGHVDRTVTSLTAALRDPDRKVRRAVVIALAALEDLAMPAVPALRALENTVDEDTDLALVKAALTRIEGEQA